MIVKFEPKHTAFSTNLSANEGATITWDRNVCNGLALYLVRKNWNIGAIVLVDYWSADYTVLGDIGSNITITKANASAEVSLTLSGNGACALFAIGAGVNISKISGGGGA